MCAEGWGQGGEGGVCTNKEPICPPPTPPLYPRLKSAAFVGCRARVGRVVFRWCM